MGYTHFFGTLDSPQPIPGGRSAEALQQLLRTRKEVWYYWQCQVEDPRVNRLFFGFLLMKSKATGAMPYVYYKATWADPYDDWLTGGERTGGMIYPSREGPINTLQWEAAREGIDDARYVTTLENLIRKAQAGERHTRAAANAQRVLDKTLGRIDMRVHTALKKLQPTDLQDARQAIAEACVELAAALQSADAPAAGK